MPLLPFAFRRVLNLSSPFFFQTSKRPVLPVFSTGLGLALLLFLLPPPVASAQVPSKPPSTSASSKPSASPPSPRIAPRSPSPVWEEVDPAAVTLLGSSASPPAHARTRPSPPPPQAPQATATATVSPAPPGFARGEGRREKADPRSDISKNEAKGSISLEALSSQMDRDQARLFKEMTELIIAPCCFVQPVSLHSSPVSDQVKVDLQRRILAGQSRDAIIAAYVQRYGERVLSIPPYPEIFWIPLLGGIFALLFCFWIIFRWMGRSRHALLPSGT